MDLQLAEIIAHDTREQAVQDARTDLHRIQQKAIEAGRDESRRLIKVSHIDHSTGQATYRPAGRLLRDWYIHCYTNALRSRLGSPAVTIDAQQVEDTTALLHRLTPDRSALAALRAVAVLRDLADADAAHATVKIAATLHTTAARRAITHAPDGRFDADSLRVHVTRHWYLHSYLDHLYTATRGKQPHTFSDLVERQVALTLTTRIIRPLVSDSAMTLTIPGSRHPDRELTNMDPATADDLQHSTKEASPEESARLMFHHRSQLQSPVTRDSEETGTSVNRLLGPSEPITESGSIDRQLPPRTA